jgi:arabinofuranan 3-O-arabinosyltransferase
LRRQVTALRVVSALLLALLAVVVYANSWGIFNTDIKPEIYLAPGEMLPRYVTAWLSSPYLGSPNFNVGLTPVVVVLAVLRWIGLNPEMAFKTFHLGIWIVAAYGANRLLRALVPRAGAWAGLAAGVAYLLNPYAVTAGSTLAIALPFAFLPWQMLAFVRALENPRSWRWPMAFGLAFFCMSGMNVAVVPSLQLLMIIPFAIVVGREQGLTWGRMVAVVAKCALAVVGVSLYWLLPGLDASATGSQVVAGSESLEGIAKVSSLVEVLRGLGMWAIYGNSPDGPWVPQFAAYLTSPFLVVLTILWAVLSLLSLVVAPTRLRRVAALSIGMSAVIMVGLFPARGSSPFGVALGWLFEHIPLLAAFRTTNKIGAVLTLSFALLLGYAVAKVGPRLLHIEGVAPMSVSVALILGFAWAAPAFSNRLYISHMVVPEYWQQAAAAVDAASLESRVMLLPGQVRANYRWSQERPDDLPNSLLKREAIIPETTPNTSAPGANFLSALDDTFQSGQGSRSVVSTMARYLGVGSILMRNDVVWEQSGGARPGQTAIALSHDPGLFGQGNFGFPGEYVIAPGQQNTQGIEPLLAPLQLYDVIDNTTTIRTEPLKGSMVIAGDGWAIPQLTAAGLLESNPMFRYAADLSPEELVSQLGPTHRLALTDTNQRREAITNRLTAGYGALLPENSPLKITRTLWDAPDQTVLRETGAKVVASSTGGAFFDVPYGAADNVLDGNPDTSWIFGDFGRAAGQHVDITLPRPQRLDKVTVQQTEIGSVHIDEVALTAGGRTVTARLPDKGSVAVDLGGVEASSLRLTVKSTRGDGFSSVGIAEIGIPGVRTERVARLPLTLDRAYAGLDSAGKTRFEQTPLDILFQRVVNTGDVQDDTEKNLNRDFSVPVERTYAGSASVRVADAGDLARDSLDGFSPEVTARSSGSWFDNPLFRASSAADGKDDSAWIPGGRLVGSWWESTGPRRAIPQVRIYQVVSEPARPLRVNRVEITVDGRKVTEAVLKEGDNRITLPTGTRGRTVRVTMLDQTGNLEATPPRFPIIDVGATMKRGPKRECVATATLDGKDLLMKPVDVLQLAGIKDPGTAWQFCEPVTLGPGNHELRPIEGYELDSLVLRDQLDGATAAKVSDTPKPTASAPAELVSGSLTDRVVRVQVPEGGAALVLGQGYDARWTASVDGTDLGKPTVVDGFSTAWILTDPGTHTVRIRFTPQTRATIALLLSGLVILLFLGFTGWPAFRRQMRLLAERDREQAEAGHLLDGEDADWGEPIHLDEGHIAEVDEETTWPRGWQEGVTPDAAVLAETDSHGHSASQTMVLDDRVSLAATDGEWGDGDRALAESNDGPKRILPVDGPKRRLIGEAGLVLAGGIGFGWAGLIGAAVLVGYLRWHPRAVNRLVSLGAFLVLVASIVQVVVTRSTWGEVSADAVRASMWPHYVAAVGLVIALAGALRRPIPRDPEAEPSWSQRLLERLHRPDHDAPEESADDAGADTAGAIVAGDVVDGSSEDAGAGPGVGRGAATTAGASSDGTPPGLFDDEPRRPRRRLWRRSKTDNENPPTSETPDEH